MAKEYKVSFKAAVDRKKFRDTRKKLHKIKEKVIPKHKKAIAAQIKAIDVLMAACAASGPGIPPRRPPMSAVYTAK